LKSEKAEIKWQKANREKSSSGRITEAASLKLAATYCLVGLPFETKTEVVNFSETSEILTESFASFIVQAV
jgi:hypothetical protein